MTYNIVKASCGEITEGDIKDALQHKSPLVYFGPKLPGKIEDMVKRHKVSLIQSDIIYHVVDGIKAHLESRLEPVTIYNITGEAKVLQTFNIDISNRIEIKAAGCKISDGIFKKGSKIRVRRGDDIMHEGKIELIKHFKETVKEVTKGMECGICIQNYDEVEEGDVIIAFTTDQETRELGQTIKIYK
ncbi:hypothetical protein DFA_01209 [Cavenderia fasciculata]|uniref:Translation initiation factor IF- 2 domain-containing protein n=1 Tax=Cavenderia fasciculata TaxID=261658 RepID=F4PRI8_CACFS|nr:uncharacterized protein DFA_01209 [Cavenderia fasciculata]EGG21328.1 hypothetical protein DFA_01209 [Cavenderia fasciculata]|eukprot:XP_004359178.1 hypothetical protein DFA_01209 [Cavenderia fasciculata]